MRSIGLTVLAFTSALLVSCASPRPVIYPNERAKTLGPDAVQREIDDCMQVARTSGAADGRGERIARDTAKAGAVGGVTGAVVGAIGGDALRGGVIGAAGAGTAALASGMLRSDEPDPLFRRFVELCLSEKGLQVVGWR